VGLMRALQLPQYECNLKESEGKVWIFDVIRKKFVILIPEEWVRQHLVNYFVAHLGYPKSLIKIETGLSYNQLQKRSDILVYDRTGNPWMIVECKSFEVEITQKSVQQAAVYNTRINAPYVVISNGLKHICYRINNLNEVIQLKDFPLFV
jgi:hypothetical protein